MEDHIKGLLNQHSQQHKQLSCTCNANMKWSTGQSGLIRTLRQVIKSTVAWMQVSDNKLHKPPFTWMKITPKKQIHKLQVSGFTNEPFHVSKDNKTPTSKRSANSRRFMQASLLHCTKLSKLFPVSHPHRPSSQIELDQKHIYRSYPTGYRSEIYMNCTANSLMRYSMRPCPSTSSCFTGPYQRYSIGFIFWSMPPSTFWR